MPALSEKTLADLSWPSLLAALADRCHTTLGAAEARALAPLELEEARERIRLVAEARALSAAEAPPPFGGIVNIRTALARAERAGTLERAELVAVGRTVAGCARLRRHLASRQELAPGLAALAEPISELSHVSGPIEDSFEAGDRLADHASAALGPLRRKVAGLHDELKKRVRGLLDDQGLKDVLQDDFYTQREDRYVVPIRADAHRKVRGIVHGTSGSGATIFIEPEEIVDLNNRLKLAEAEVHDEEERILASLTAYVREELPAIRAGLAAATALDLLDGAARLADAMAAAAPGLGRGAPIDLRAARHPLMVLAGTECVPNDLRLEPGQSLVISGPNAGGKTVALKTVGLACLLARHGLHIPADDGSSVPFVARILTDMGDDQSIEKNLSTFSAHIMHVRGFLKEADADTLVLVDEMAAGTDPEQGAALAQAVLEALAERGARVLVTTHYERLKALAPRDARFVNASVGFDVAALTPTFKLHVGLPGASGALAVARRLGLDGAVVARAEALVGDAGRDVEELLASVEAERKRLEDEVARVRVEHAGAAEARRQAEASAQVAAERARVARKGAHDDAVAALRQARLELDHLRGEVRKAEASQASELRARIDRAGKQIFALAPEAPAPRGRPAREDELVAGALVIVPALGDGVLLGPPERGRVNVRVGALRTTIDAGELRILERGERPRPAGGTGATGPGAGKHAGKAPPHTTFAPDPDTGGADDDEPTARTAEGTIDLRGQRADEALANVDRFLDDALLAGREVVCVLHGHGTGALRAAVREHLAAHPCVGKLRPGTPREGGDGVTLAWLT